MVERAGERDLETLLELALALWPEHTAAEMREEILALLNDGQAALFLALADEFPVGFAQCQLRHDYVEGTDSSPVGYLEGIFVREPYRNHGYARALLSACEAWASAQGCREFASDCEIGNQDSWNFHMHTGFCEAGRIICFVKKLPSGPDV